MDRKELIIETADRKEKFELDEFGGKFYVFAVSQNMMGSKQTKKIGEATTRDAAVELAKVFTGRPVIRVIEKDG